MLEKNTAHPYQPIEGGPAQLPWLWLGTWSLGGEGFGRVPGSDARTTIELAFGRGIRHFDTAGFYAHGKSEVLLGKALRGFRRQVFLSTKGGLWRNNNQVTHDASPRALRRACAESLDRLGTDYLDLFQLHWPDDSNPLEESLETLRNLQREGMIRYWGVGNLDASQVHAFLPSEARIPHQVHHNPLHRADEILEAGNAEQRTYNCIVSPLEQGLLGATRSSRGIAGLANRDIRRRNPFFHDPRVQEWVRVFQDLSIECKLPRASLILLWILAQPDVDAVIAGPKTPTQLKELLAHRSHREWIGSVTGKTRNEMNRPWRFEQLPKRFRAVFTRALWDHISKPPDSERA